MMPTLPQIAQQVELSLKTRAPLTYQEMQRQGTLPAFLADQSEQMEDSYLQAFAAARTKLLSQKLSQQELEDRLYQAQTSLWEQTRAEFLDFQDSPEQKAAAVSVNLDVQRKLKQQHARWMEDCPEQDRAEMEWFWETEQRQTALNRILDEMDLEHLQS